MTKSAASPQPARKSDVKTTTVETSGGTTTTSPSTSSAGGQSSSQSGGTTTTGPSSTTTTTVSDPYKTEFVKVYQDAGVVGVAMLTLLVIVAVLAILAFRLAKMYSNLITSRENLEGTRTTVLEKLTESILSVKAEVGTIDGQLETVRSEIIQNRSESSRIKDEVLSEVRRVCDRIDRLDQASSESSGPRGRGRRT
jgi:hypothetical protein